MTATVSALIFAGSAEPEPHDIDSLPNCLGLGARVDHRLEASTILGLRHQPRRCSPSRPRKSCCCRLPVNRGCLPSNGDGGLPQGPLEKALVVADVWTVDGKISAAVVRDAADPVGVVGVADH